MIEALEAWGPAAFLRTSFYLYPLLNAAHILAIGALVTSAALMDGRVLGLGRELPLEAVIDRLRPIAIGALIVAALTGFLMFSVQPFDYLANPAFRLKMLLLLGAVANAFLFTSFRAHRRPDKTSSRAMAIMSIGLWLSVLVAGRFIGFLGR
jgi:hypothetical protein